jgi:hypothetical protein
MSISLSYLLFSAERLKKTLPIIIVFMKAGGKFCSPPASDSFLLGIYGFTTA